MVTEICIDDVIVGKCFEAKKPKSVGFPPLIDDRQVKWISLDRDRIQFDSPSVGFGRKYPTVSMASFLKWAGRDITNLMPKDEWRSMERVTAGYALFSPSTQDYEVSKNYGSDISTLARLIEAGEL